MSRWRYIAQRPLTGEFVEWDVPLRRDELTWVLSGPGSLRGTVSPDVGAARGADGQPVLTEWGTALYAEASGEIRWGGLVTRSAFAGQSWQVEATSFAGYLSGLPYLGSYERTGLDPVDAARELWAHVQSYPDGNLGVVVSGGPTPVRLGVAAVGTPGQGGYVEADPYRLVWYEAPDCGSEMDALAQETPFDYVERHYWSGQTVAHEVAVAYPRHGRRRGDLAFRHGDNVVGALAVSRGGEGYANEVYLLGAGEGSSSLRTSVSARDGRVRRAAVVTRKDVSSPARLAGLARKELSRRRLLLSVEEITVVDHPNAPFGSWALGDDVLVEADIPHLGRVSVWSRVVGWSLLGEDTARLDLARSDSFTYGAWS